MTYTAKSDIEAMAHGAFDAWNPNAPLDSARLSTIRVNQRKPFVAGYGAGAAITHAQLARVKAERDVYRDFAIASDCGRVCDKGNFSFAEQYPRSEKYIDRIAKQVLQQKGGEDENIG